MKIIKPKIFKENKIKNENDLNTFTPKRIFSQKKFFFRIFCLILIIYTFRNVKDLIIFQKILSFSKKAKLVLFKEIKEADLLKPKTNNLNSKSKDKKIDDSESLKLDKSGALMISSGPSRISTEEEKIENDSISLYEVKKGDTLKIISDLFQINQNSIIWANNLKNKNVVPGDILLIFPVNGFEYTFLKNGTINELAKKYNIDAEEISKYNDIDINKKLSKGAKIFIPDAEGEVEEEYKKELSKIKKSTKIISKKVNNLNYKSGSGYFLKPLSSSACRKSQNLHGPYSSAVDWGCPIGTPVYAAADGVIIRSTLGGYNGGYGSVVIISHANKSQTIYAHLNNIYVSAGQRVSKGQNIGTTGNTGKSTGPHLHFETRGIKNPF